MATKKITDLTRVTSANNTDLLIVETSEGTRSISKSNLASSIISGITMPTVPTKLSQLTDDSTHRLVTDTEKSTWNGKVDSSHTHSGTYINPHFIELTPSASANNGGYIDFHYNGSSSDYTSRIIESTSGTLDLSANIHVKNPSVNYSYARNIHAGTTDLTAGSSSLDTGAIYIVYE